jgi:hypothetical protein
VDRQELGQFAGERMKLVPRAHPIEKWRWLLEAEPEPCLLNQTEAQRERPPLVVVAESETPTETER